MNRNDFLKIIGGGATGLMFTGAVDASKKLLFDKKCIKIYDNYVRGLSHYDWRKIYKNLNVKDKVILKRDLDNKYDSFAVAIYWNEYKLGYFPAYENIVLSNLMDNGVEVESYISNIEYDKNKDPYFQQSLAVEVFTDLLVPIHHIKVKELTNDRADDIEDIYRKGD